jgi:hypothetical protein
LSQNMRQGVVTFCREPFTDYDYPHRWLCRHNPQLWVFLVEKPLQKTPTLLPEGHTVPRNTQYDRDVSLLPNGRVGEHDQTLSSTLQRCLGIPVV